MKVAELGGDVLLRQPVPAADEPRLDRWFADDPSGAWQAFLERPSPDQRAVVEEAIEAAEHHCWIVELGEPGERRLTRC